jgi:hypothetical protein
MISSDGLQSSLGEMNSVRRVSPYSYLEVSSDESDEEDDEVEAEDNDASEGVDKKSGRLFPFDEEDVVLFFVLLALKRKFIVYFDPS